MGGRFRGILGGTLLAVAVMAPALSAPLNQVFDRIKLDVMDQDLTDSRNRPEEGEWPLPGAAGTSEWMTCPGDRTPLRTWVEKTADELGRMYLYCQACSQYWVVTGDARKQWFSGPYVLENRWKKELERVEKTLRVITRAFVEKVLVRQITPTGGFGYYDDQFVSLRELGEPGKKALLEILDDPGTDSRLTGLKKQLALEALAEFRDASLAEKIRPLAQDRGEDEGVRETAAFTLARLGDRREIERYLEKYRIQIRLAPGSEQGYSGLAGVYIRMKESRLAREYYLRALRIQPGNMVSYYNLACAYAVEKEPHRAFACLKKAVEKGYRDFEWLKKDGDLRLLLRFPVVLRWVESQEEMSEGTLF